jgi:hypothetical protein
VKFIHLLFSRFMECQLVGKLAMLHSRAMTASTFVGGVVAGGDLGDIDILRLNLFRASPTDAQ